MAKEGHALLSPAVPAGSLSQHDPGFAYWLELMLLVSIYHPWLEGEFLAGQTISTLAQPLGGGKCSLLTLGGYVPAPGTGLITVTRTVLY